MRIFPTKNFDKKLDKCSQEIQLLFADRLDVFGIDPYHPLLHNHALSGKFHGYRSFNVSGDWRVIFEEVGGDVFLISIGTHSQLYK